MGRVWFGTKDRMEWIKAPLPGVDRSVERWRASGQYLSGGAWTRQSATGARKASFTWPVMTEDEIEPIDALLSGIYGHTYYYCDPFARNLLPAWLASPGLGGPSLYEGATPVPTPSNSYGYPSSGAAYTVAGTGRKWRFPVPPNKTLHLGVHGDVVSGAPQVSVTNSSQGEPLVATNLALNPSFEASSGTVELRRNLIQNPRGTGVVAGWSLNNQGAGSGGSISVSTVTEAITLPDGTQVPSCRRKTWTVTPSQGADIAWQFYSSNRGAVTAGQTYTVQYAWRKSFAGTVTANIFQILFYNSASGGNQVGTTVNGPALTNPAPNVWQQDSITFTVPAGATHCTVVHAYNISNPAILVPGVTFDATAALAEAYPVKGKYFDGGSSPDPDLTPAWTGAANASASVLNGVAVVGQNAGGGAAYQVRISSTQWSKSGTRSFRNIPLGTSNDTHSLGIDGDAGGMRLGMVAGGTYTALVTMRLSQPLTGSLASRSRTITLFSRVGAGPYVYSSSAQAPNAAGEHQLRYTFTVPPDATEAFIRLLNGASAGNGDVWWDDLMIVKGVYAGPYFDGSNPPPPNMTASWTGAPNNSTSNLYAYSTNNLTLLPVTTDQLTNYSYTAPPEGGWVEVFLQGSGELNLYGIHAELADSPPVGSFKPGRGYSGLELSGDPTNTGYSAAVAGGRESISADFTETEPWQ